MKMVGAEHLPEDFVDDAESQRGPDTVVIDLHGRRVVPGLDDSHLHVIRGGLHYNMELRWDGVPSLADGLRMLKEQIAKGKGCHSSSPFLFASRRRQPPKPRFSSRGRGEPESETFVSVQTALMSWNAARPVR